MKHTSFLQNTGLHTFTTLTVITLLKTVFVKKQVPFIKEIKIYLVPLNELAFYEKRAFGHLWHWQNNRQIHKQT